MKFGIEIPLTLAMTFGMTTSGWAAPTVSTVDVDATKYVVKVEGMT